jgi:hypothetical protein
MPPGTFGELFEMLLAPPKLLPPPLDEHLQQLTTYLPNPPPIFIHLLMPLVLNAFAVLVWSGIWSHMSELIIPEWKQKSIGERLGQLAHTYPEGNDRKSRHVRKTWSRFWSVIEAYESIYGAWIQGRKRAKKKTKRSRRRKKKGRR